MTTTVDLGGRSVARIGLGTNRLADTSENRDFLRAAVDAGLQFIDTAHLYAGGESERAIGNALSPFPDDLVIATKGGYHEGEAHPSRLRDQLEQSFERLRTETICVYYVHRLDAGTPIDETMGLLSEYRDAGRIEHVGLSEVTVEQIERAREVVPIAAVQNELNLADRSWDVVDFCEAEGIVFVPFYPLHGAKAGRRVARRYGATPEQVALAWLLKRSPSVAPIPGTLSIEHLRENLAAFDLELSDEDFAALSGS
jgi:aryl-alcohol dehydrogenase-like predicted oxidoreductase